MKLIRISINEFKALLNRACEVHYGHQYDYEDLFIKMSDLENEKLLNQESQRIVNYVTLNFSEEILIQKFKKIMVNT